MHSDAFLLEAFIQNRDESAFRGMVERYAPMVHGVVWRKTQNRTLAEEVTQTVFTILARKAGGLRHAELAGWLHRAAAMETRNAVRKEQRRDRALRRLALDQSMSPDVNPGPAWGGIAPHLDEAMAGLSPAERQIIVLRYFEQRSHREIAEATGRSEPASRKQVQRSLDRLGILLRRRGIATSGAALGAVLSSQTLCATPASAAGAASLAAAALQSAPSLSAATIFTHTLYTMTASTILKTATATAVLAAVPIGLLWEQNHTLRNEVSQLRAAAQVSSRPAISGPAAPAVAAVESAPDTAGITDGRTGISSSAGKPGEEENPLAAFASLFAGEGLVKLAEGQIRQDVTREAGRLSRRLNLSAEQKEKLQAYLEEKHGRGMEAFKKVSADGLLARAMRDPGSLTPAERARLEELGQEGADLQDMDSFLKSMLDDGQFAEYEKSKAEQHTARAEEKAQEMLTSLGQHLNLSSDQKDKIFQAVAARELAKPLSAGGENAEDAAARTAGEAMAQDGRFDTAALMAELATGDRGNDDILQEILTAEQFAVFQNARTEEAKQSRAVLETMFPAFTGGDKTEAPARGKN